MNNRDVVEFFTGIWRIFMMRSEMFKQYVWLNPVVEAMAGPGYPDLLRQIAARGFTVVSCANGAEKVREDYRQCLETGGKKPVIDTRCPLITRMIRQDYPELTHYLAVVPPILMTCAFELYDTYVKGDPEQASLLIVTPCSALAEQGNTLFGEMMRFVTWNYFYLEQKLCCEMRRVAASPIPPGFFQFPAYRVLEASGEERVRQLLARIAQAPGEADLLELLYCQGGCHNGDGV